MRIAEVSILLEDRAQYIKDRFGKDILTYWKEVARNRQFGELDSIGDTYYSLTDKKKKQELESKILDYIIDLFKETDPTPQNKYIVWIARLFANGKVFLEDLYKLEDDLELFSKVRTKLKKKDIMAYKTPLELYNALEEVRENPELALSHSEQRRRQREALYTSGQAEVVYEDSEYKIVIPKTPEAACELSKGTRWCTADTQNYHYYSQIGPLYIIFGPMPKAPWQLHIPTTQFMDSSDVPVDAEIESHPPIVNFLAEIYAKSIVSVYRGDLFIDESAWKDALVYITGGPIAKKMYNILQENSQLRNALESHLTESVNFQLVNIAGPSDATFYTDSTAFRILLEFVNYYDLDVAVEPLINHIVNQLAEIGSIHKYETVNTLEAIDRFIILASNYLGGSTNKILGQTLKSITENFFSEDLEYRTVSKIAYFYEIATSFSNVGGPYAKEYENLLRRLARENLTEYLRIEGEDFVHISHGSLLVSLHLYGFRPTFKGKLDKNYTIDVADALIKSGIYEKAKDFLKTVTKAGVGTQSSSKLVGFVEEHNSLGK